LADTQWRLNSIPGLESALRVLAQARGTQILSHPDPTIQNLLLKAQAEVAEAKAIKNIRLQESRLLRRYERDEEELKKLRNKRFAQEEAQQRAEREQQRREEEEQCRRERAQKRAERKQAREAAETKAQPVLLEAHGFEFSTSENIREIGAEQLSKRPENPDSLLLRHCPNGPDSSC
jgi:membrane-bound lytic murein transglycosylase